MIIDRAVYRDGRRTAEPDDLGKLHAASQTGDALVWLDLYEPTGEEFSTVAREFGLHELAVEDAVKAGGRRPSHRGAARRPRECRGGGRWTPRTQFKYVTIRAAGKTR